MKKEKVNPIPKTLRERKRYLIIETEPKIIPNIRKLIYDKTQELYGLINTSKINMNIISNNLIKVNRDYVDEMINVFNYINIKEKTLKITVKKVCGTIKSGEKNE